MSEDEFLNSFWGNVRILGDDDCWPWLGKRRKVKGKAKSGYGIFPYGSTNYTAHRIAYNIVNKDLSHEMVVDHLCKNPCCNNPSHLEQVTNKENIARGTCPTAINGVKSHCIHGHPFSGDNLRLRRRVFGKSVSIVRVCMECKRAEKIRSRMK